MNVSRSSTRPPFAHHPHVFNLVVFSGEFLFTIRVSACNFFPRAVVAIISVMEIDLPNPRKPAVTSGTPIFAA